MRADVWTRVAAVALCLSGPPLAAHHSTAAEFDLDKPVTVKGTLTKIDWINPHCWIHIDVKNPDGTVVSWAFETGGPIQLMRQGWRRTDLPIGAEVTIRGFEAKPGVFAKPSGTTRSVTLPDGKQLFNGPAPGSAER
jgi:hypothetical protein